MRLIRVIFLQNQFLFPEDLQSSSREADSAIDLSIPRVLSPEPILSIDYDREDSNQDGDGDNQDSGFVHGSDPANQGKTVEDDGGEDLEDTAEIDVESISNPDEFDAPMEDNPVPMESSTPTRTRSSTPVPSAVSSRQCSPTRSNTPTRGSSPSRSTTPVPSTSYPEGLERGKEVNQESGLLTGPKKFTYFDFSST